MTSSAPHDRARALPIGRLLRFLTGLAFILAVVPVYGRLGAPLSVRAGLLVLGLLAAYSLIHLFAARYPLARPPWLGASLALAPLVVTYAAGGLGGFLLGRGEGRLAAVTFVGASLLLAAARADAGCEVMSIPGALFRKRSYLPCLVFTPIDRLERRLRGTRHDSG